MSNSISQKPTSVPHGALNLSPKTHGSQSVSAFPDFDEYDNELAFAFDDFPDLDETDNEKDNDNELSSMHMALLDFDDLVDFVEALLPFPYAPLMVTRLMTAVVSFMFFLLEQVVYYCT